MVANLKLRDDSASPEGVGVGVVEPVVCCLTAAHDHFFITPFQMLSELRTTAMA